MHTNPAPVCSNTRPSRLDETSAGANGIDEGRKEAGRQEKKKKRFWRCGLNPYFSQRGTYYVAKAQKGNQRCLSVIDGKITYDMMINVLIKWKL